MEAATAMMAASAAMSLAKGFMGGDSSKTTLPWLDQYPGWLLFSMFSPQGYNSFQKVKPKMFNQVFGKDFDQSQLDPYRRYIQNYDPFSFLASNPYGRPGGASQQEQDLLNNSLFGMTAPLDLSAPSSKASDFSSFLSSLKPRNVYGLSESPLGFTGTPVTGQKQAKAQDDGSGSMLMNVGDPATWQTGQNGVVGVASPSLATGGGTSASSGTSAAGSGSTFTGFPGTQGMPAYPQGWNPDQQPGLTYVPGQGWTEVKTGADVTWDSGTNTFYYHGYPITEGMAMKLKAQGPSALTTSAYQDQTQDVFASLGGQLKVPDAPTLDTLGRLQLPDQPTLGPLQLPSAPQLGAFQSPNVGNLAYGTYRQFANGTPGFDDAISRALNPQIAMPGQSIFDQVAAQRAQGGPMDKYVDAASGAVQKAADQRYQDLATQLKSQFASEGTYNSGPMLNALASLAGASNADVTNTLAQMRLNAADTESGRIYGAATQQYNNELARNTSQAQLSAQSAAQLADTYGRIAQATGSAEAQTMADAYKTQAQYLSSNYGTQVGALTSAYGDQAKFLSSNYGTLVNALTSEYGDRAGFLKDVYSTGLQGALSQQNLAANQATARMAQQLQAQGMSFDQAMELAKAQQANNQEALNALIAQYYQPGKNALDVFDAFKYGNVSKASKSNSGGGGGGMGMMGM